MITVAGGCWAMKARNWSRRGRSRRATWPARSEIATSKTAFATSTAMRVSFDMMGSSFCSNPAATLALDADQGAGEVHLINAAHESRDGWNGAVFAAYLGVLRTSE